MRNRIAAATVFVFVFGSGCAEARHAHRDLDVAVAAAYGWAADLTGEQILEQLFALNQERAAKQ